MTRGVVAHGGSGWQLRQGGSHPRIGLESRFSVVEEMRRVGALPVSRPPRVSANTPNTHY